MAKDEQQRLTAHGQRVVPGIIHFAQVPHRMNPEQLRNKIGAQMQRNFSTHLAKYKLQGHGIGRIYLVPKEGIAKKKLRQMEYKEGYVEFVDKRYAKRVADLLHSQQVGGSNKQHSGDTWVVQYVSGATWDDLVAKQKYLKGSRDKRVDRELARIQEDTEFITAQIDQARSMEGMKKRKGGAFVDKGGKKEKKVEKKDKKRVTERKMDDALLDRLLG